MLSVDGQFINGSPSRNVGCLLGFNVSLEFDICTSRGFGELKD